LPRSSQRVAEERAAVEEDREGILYAGGREKVSALASAELRRQVRVPMDL